MYDIDFIKHRLQAYKPIGLFGWTGCEMCMTNHRLVDIYGYKFCEYCLYNRLGEFYLKYGTDISKSIILKSDKKIDEGFKVDVEAYKEIMKNEDFFDLFREAFFDLRKMKIEDIEEELEKQKEAYVKKLEEDEFEYQIDWYSNRPVCLPE